MASNRPKTTDADDPKVRIPGETDSPQNQLRAELYKEAFDRIGRALETERYFEAIALQDTIMSDRIQALIQTIKHEEDTQYPWQSVGGAIAALNVERKDRAMPKFDKCFRKLLDDIEKIWLPMRNIAFHGFVTVLPSNIDKGVDERMGDVKECAEIGIKYTRALVKMTKKIIDELKRGSESNQY